MYVVNVMYLDYLKLILLAEFTKLSVSDKYKVRWCRWTYFMVGSIIYFLHSHTGSFILSTFYKNEFSKFMLKTKNINVNK